MSTEDQKTFEYNWKIIQSEALDIVYRLGVDNNRDAKIQKDTRMKVYNLVYEICTCKKTEYQEKCYKNLVNSLTAYAQKLYKLICDEKSSIIRMDTQTRLLTKFVFYWKSFDEIVLTNLFNFFSFFRRQTIKTRRNINIEKDLKEIFRVEIYEKIKEKLQKEFLILRENERDDARSIDPDDLKNFVGFLGSIQIGEKDNQMSLYQKEFEKLVIDESISYHTSFVKSADKTNVIEYIAKSNDLLNSEELRILNYLPLETINTITTRLKQIMFFDESQNLLENSRVNFDYLLSEMDLQNISICFNVFLEDKHSMNLMLAIFKKNLRFTFKKLIDKHPKLQNIQNLSQELGFLIKSNYIQDYMKFYNSYNKMISTCFKSTENNYSLFLICFREVVEKMQSEYSHYNLSYIFPFYLDVAMRNDKSDVSEIVDNLICIFPILPDKDVFMELHKNLLIGRLCCLNFEKEKTVISKIKVIAGHNFTNLVEEMLDDFESGKNFSQEFLKRAAESENLRHKVNFEYNVSVVSNLNWSLFGSNTQSDKDSQIGLNLPQELEGITKINSYYEDYYREINPKKAIKFSHLASTVEVEAKLGQELVTLNTSFIGYLILRQFNKKPSIEYDEIIKNINLFNEEVNSNLTKMIDKNILLKSDGSKSTLFTLNKGYSSINYVDLTYYDKSQELVRKEKIEDDRSAAIEACIVRIMKQDKRQSHYELIKKVNKQLEEYFLIRLELIQKRIEQLIERDIITCDPNDPFIYLYKF